MHLHTDDQLASFSKTELLEYYAKHNIQLPSNLSEDNLRLTLATHERTRIIMVWHDHSEILGHDYVLVTVKIIYDPAVFKSVSDIYQTTAQSIPDLQAYTEEPEIHVLAMNLSSIEDQAALISNRMECIRELNTDLKTADNITISNKLLFFSGDKPNSNVEPKSCGAHVAQFDDLPYCANHKWRSLQAIQSTIIKGMGCVHVYRSGKYCMLNCTHVHICNIF